MSARDRTALPPSIVARVTDPVFVDSNGRSWVLGFDSSTSPPGVIWTPLLTWGYMKTLFASWGTVRAEHTSWAAAKGLV